MEQETRQKCCRSFIRKHIWIAIIFALIPLVLSVACYFSIPFFNHAGSSAWLSFWGGYLGSTIMAGITLYVLDKQLKQNHEENENNRKTDRVQNQFNRELTLNLRKQEIELAWFEDLKSACIKLDGAFNNDDVIIASDIDPLSDQFNDTVSKLLTRMNEAYFNFKITISYHKNVTKQIEVLRLERFVAEYISLLSDMNSLHVYGYLLIHALEDIDLSPEETEVKLKNFILNHKENMSVPEIKDNRVWDLLINNSYDDIESLNKIMTILRNRVDRFHLPDVRLSIINLLNSEYQKARVSDNRE